MSYERYRDNAHNNLHAVAPVNVTDIIVAPSGRKPTAGNYAGEFGIPTDNPNQAHTGKSVVTRIEDHIRLFAKMANREHEKANFKKYTSNEGSVDQATWFEIIPDKRNEVTRLSFYEFAFYPKDRPLTLDEYHSLLKKINNIAADCHENLHLLLASFPVEWPDKKVYNIVIHVQCGKQPVLSPFAKSVPSSIDAVYSGTINPSFRGSSHQPKVLQAGEGVLSSADGKKYTLKETVDRIFTHATPATKNTSLRALVDLNKALIADKNSPPPQSLLACIHSCFVFLKANGNLDAANVNRLNEEIEKFRAKANEETMRFRNAANLVLPRPDIIPNGVLTEHYGRYSFQGMIDYIKTCENKVGQSAQAKEVLEAAKRSLTSIARENPTYLPPTALVSHIDVMLAKLPGSALTTAEVDKFAAEMRSYGQVCQNKYVDDYKLISRPEIISKLIKDDGVGFFSIDTIRSNFQYNAIPDRWDLAKKLLIAVKNNINKNNASNGTYAPDSMALLAHIDHLLNNYFPSVPPFFIVPDVSEFDKLSTELENYRKACESRYQSNVRLIIPEVSAGIGNTVGHAVAKPLDEIAMIVKNNLDDPTKLDLAYEQLIYLRKNLLFSEKESNSETAHPLLKQMDQLLEKLSNKVNIEPAESDSLKRAIENYNKESLSDRLESLITIINQRMDKNLVYSESVAQLSRTLNYLQNIEALSLDSKKAITTIKNSLAANHSIDPRSLQELKRALTIDNAIVAKMPYWHFPQKIYSENISYDSTVLCRTHGQTEFWTSSHICLDMSSAIGLRSFNNNLAAEMAPPLYFSEVVTSNSVKLEKAHTINPKGKVTHADVTSTKGVGNNVTTEKSSAQLRKTLMGTRDLSTEKTLDLNPLAEAAGTPKDPAYLTSFNTTDPDQLIVEKPPFGPDCVMRKYDTHQLSPMPISLNAMASIDSYAANYYIKRLDALMHSLELPLHSLQQKEGIKEFLEKLHAIKNTATGEHFYKLLNDFENKVKAIRDEETSPLLRQIHAMKHYLDTKLLSLESYIVSNVLSPLGDVSPEQNDVENSLKKKLEDIAKQPVNFSEKSNLAIIPKELIVDAVIEFRKQIVTLGKSGQNIEKLKEKYVSIEKYLQEHYPEIHSEIKNIFSREGSEILSSIDFCLQGEFVKNLSAEKVAALRNLETKLKDDAKIGKLNYFKDKDNILDLPTLRKAWDEFNREINSIKDQHMREFNELRSKVNGSIGRLEALNMGEEYHLELLRSKSEAIQHEIDQLNKINSEHEIKLMPSYREAHQDLKNNLQDTKATLNNMNNKLAIIEKELKILKDQKQTAVQQIEALNIAKQQLGELSEKYQPKKLDLDTKLAELKVLVSEIDTLKQQEITDARLMQAMQQEKSALEETLRSLEAEKAKIEANTGQNGVGEKECLDQKIASVKSEILIVESEISKKQSEIESNGFAVDFKKYDIDELHSSTELPQQELNKLEQQIAKQRAIIEQLSVQPSLGALDEKIQQLSKDKAKLEFDISVKQNETDLLHHKSADLAMKLHESSAQIQSNKEQQKTLEASKKEIDEAHEHISRLRR